MTSLTELQSLLENSENLDSLTDKDLLELQDLIQKLEVNKSTNAGDWYEPYEKQKQLLSQGGKYRQRLFLAGNRCGKTHTGSHEMAYHLTGRYPEWWEGKKFTGPVNIWAASNTSESTRDILQNAYLGDINNKRPDTCDRYRGIIPFGCGAIAHDCILGFTRKRGTPDAVDVVRIQHYDSNGNKDGESTLAFKSYDQGRAKFQGTARHGIHLDEEPPWDVYEECILRLAGDGIKGILLLTMTPLDGMTDVCESFLDEKSEKKLVVQMSWDEAGHLSKEERDTLLDGMPPHQQEAREKGIPALGSGKVYPVEEKIYLCDPFEFPDYYKHFYSLDFGWKDPTSAIFFAHDPQTDTLYAYDEYYVSQQDPIIHASTLNVKGGTWMTGAADPAGMGSSQADGEKLFDIYREHGLDIEPADNSIESGIMQVLTRLRTGRLKIFTTLQYTMTEMRRYSRDEKGKIKQKQKDHLMDCLRYGTVSGIELSKLKPRNPGNKRGSRGLYIKQAATNWKTV